ncbi:filamentous hemagglutinin N-terminal domain-containing protein, partial [Paraburkholderia sediminicola]|uniref:filamentous hemagglutinin N-terminal domain-containing protein n=1 Tax=Paraburkholderia sediminicola TaxID=458836 RepID=UPI0015819C33
MKQHRLNVLNVATLAALGVSGSAIAGGIVSAGGQTQVVTPGNTPIVNIAGANSAGVSRNTFSNFDVDKNGVVFNNLTAAGVSQLAGQLAANANLKGTAAKVIVADVNSAQASKLNGAMEVAGAPAHLLIANAAGISVNGATTINAPVLTLAAASFNPRADSPLALSVDTNRATPATIEINGDGLNVGAGQVNLLSRATLVNATVKGWTINSQNGTQFDGDADGNFAGKLTADAAGAKPAIALDVSELGGMYANRIVLEGSEHGLGVNSAGRIAAGKGGLAVQMYGADIALRGSNAHVDLEGFGSIVRSAEHGGLDEAQYFTAKKQEAAAEHARVDAYFNYSPADDANLSDSSKIALINDLAWRTSDAGRKAANDAAQAEQQQRQAEADRLAWDAEQERLAKEQAARQAQMEADREAWEANHRAEQQRAEEAQQAEQERLAKDQAARQAQMEADRQAWEANHRAEQQRAEEARAAAQAAQQAEQQRLANEQAARQAQMEADYKAWQANQ